LNPSLLGFNEIAMYYVDTRITEVNFNSAFANSEANPDSYTCCFN